MNWQRPTIPERYELIWKKVRGIPRGKVSTYGVIAGLAGMAGQSRLVGYAMHSLPEGSGVPWHRVINARGEISIPVHRRSGRIQKSLLESEGVEFSGKKVDLKKSGWPPARFR